MGQTLSEPVTSKETTVCSNETFICGASSMQGWRINMEDSHTHILSLQEDPAAAFFAVYDGHGGSKVAEYAGNNLHKRVVNQPQYKEGNVVDALKYGFLSIDSDMLCDPEMRDELAGTTAVCCLIKDNKIYCANVGDSRAVASSSGVADALSNDHKPSNENEAKRITAAGGWVEFNRVNGNLALSRALGDFVFKKNDRRIVTEQIVIAEPDIEIREINDDLEFIVIACDGIWDVMTNEEVVEFIRCRIAKKMEPSVICEELMTRCLAPDCQMGGLGCDNMTVVLVCYLNGKSYDELSDRCSALPMTRRRMRSSVSSANSSPSTSCSSSTPETDEEIAEAKDSQTNIAKSGDVSDTASSTFSKLSTSVSTSDGGVAVA